jgi:hypothetical protein
VSEPQSQPRIEFESHADPAMEAGVYANGLAIWHTMPNENLTMYEQKFGQIRTPGPDAPLYPPGAPPGGNTASGD